MSEAAADFPVKFVSVFGVNNQTMPQILLPRFLRAAKRAQIIFRLGYFNNIFSGIFTNQGLGRSLRQYFPMVHYYQVIAKTRGFIHVMSSKQNSHSLFFQAFQFFPYLMTRLRIKTRCRFIQNQEFRLIDQGAGDDQSATIPPESSVARALRRCSKAKNFNKDEALLMAVFLSRSK